MNIIYQKTNDIANKHKELKDTKLLTTEAKQAEIQENKHQTEIQNNKDKTGLINQPTKKTIEDIAKTNGKLTIEDNPIFNKPALELQVQNQIGDTNQLMQGNNPATKQDNIKLDKDSTNMQKADLTESNTKGNTHERQENTRRTADKQDATATKSESIERDYRAGSKGLDNNKSDSPKGLHEPERIRETDNEPSNANGFKSQEIPQEKSQDNARGEKDLRAEPSNSSLNTESSDDILREGEGHNARIGFKQDNNIGFNAGGNNNQYQTSPRFRSRNVSLTHKGAKQKGSTQENITQDNPALTTKEIIKEAKEQGLSVKETQKLVDENNAKQGILNKTQARKDIKEVLTPLIGKEITNAHNQMKVMLSSDSIKKMTSNKVFQKSLDNGFSEAQHFEAVKDIKSLYENAIPKESLNDLKHGDPAIKIHRFNSDFKNANALITIKESLDKDLRKIYSVELELSPQPLAKLGRNTSQQGNANLTKTTASKYLAPIEKHLDNSTIRKPTKEKLKELQGNLPQIKQKTIQAVDRYAQSEEFKALSKDKQEAILSLKEIIPAKMPEGITSGDLENLIKHFSSKQDKEQRGFYAKLIEDTKQNPHILLEVERDGQLRKEYIKAYQHKENKDLYYIAITQDNDKINITAFPTTQINKVIGDIKKSNKVAEALERIQQTATPLQSNPSPQGAKDIIQQESKKPATKKPKKVKEVEKEADNFQSSSNPAGLLNPEEKALIQQSFKQKDLEEIISAKRLYDLNMDSLKLLKDILENPRVLSDSEKEVLSNFRGFGKASNELFKNIKEKGEAYKELESLLNSLSEHLGEKITPLDLMKRSSDAFYTPMPIIREMVGLAESFGLKKEHYVLEPSVGVGRFLSELSNKGLNIHGIEIDSISAKLASLIYPNVKINKSGFEKSKYAIDNFYDLVIGNPPYGNFIIKDDNFRASAHNYFMKKGINNLAENGISIQVVTHNFMDAKDRLTRQKIAQNAAFIGGVRLPNNAFKDAKVTTDILVFRKAGKGEKLDNSWIETSDFNGIQVSKYFLDNPQNVLGNMQVGKGQFGDVIEVVNKDFDINSLKLQEYIKHDNLALTTHKSNREALLQEVEEANKEKEVIGENSPLTIKDNEIYKHGNKLNVEAELKELTTWSDSTITQRVKALKEMLPDINNVRETLSKLQNAERNGLEYETIENLRKSLNTQYQKLVGKNSSFYNKNGAISQKFKAYELLDDESFELFALEQKAIVENDKVVGAIKSDIFTKRVNYPYIAPQSADSLQDAIAISLNETGIHNYARIAELLGKDVESVKKDLLDSKIHYLDSNGEHITKEVFLSGDVKTRLESFHDENGLPKFSDNETIRKYQEIAYNDLKNVIPDDIELPLVNIPLGANWLDKNITDSFLRDALEVDIRTSYIHGVGWNFKYDKYITTGRDLTIATSDKFREQTGISTIDGAYYLEDMFNNKTLKVQKTIFSKEKPNAVTYTDPIASQSLESMKKQLQAEFKNFILENESFTDIAQKQYNDTFNRIVQRKYDGSHIQLIGKNADISMREHQNNAIFRFLQESSTLLAHDVGTGKSYTMVASSIEAKRIGIIKKPMIVVPNNVAPQLAAEARRLYPNAKIQLVQAVSKRDKNKQLARIKNNDNDITITTYTAFTNMNISPSYFERYIQDELALINKIIEKLKYDKDTSKRAMNAALNKRDKLKQKLENYIQEIENEKQNLFFDDLGIDSLMFDEAHYLKNLPIQTAQRNVRGIGQSNSQRALDAMMKATHVFDNDKGKVLFATGTPITNFISDVYVLQRFLDVKGLESAGIEHFDEWCKQFAGAASEFELKPTGDYKLTTRLRDFTNLPELKNQYLKFADVVTKDDMKKAAAQQGIKNLEPEIERINVVIDKNEAQAEFMEQVKLRAEEIEKNKKASMEKGSDNMLKIINDSNKASLDMRLIDKSLERDSNGKIAQSANNIYENYKQYENVKGTQLVFLDTSVPKKKASPQKLAKLQSELQTLQKKIDSYEEVGDFEKLESLNKKKEELEIEIEQYKDGFSVYDDLKEVLIEKGIKENEIAFIHDYQAEGNSKFSKNALREKINSGEVRVLIGSTGKMGAGSNFQERLVALHHLDLNWTPANMEQREGRIIRQGNRLIDKIPNFKAKIYTYVTKEMSDALMLQTLQQKQKIIKQIANPHLKERFIEDTSEDNLHGRLKAMASPNAEQHLEFMGLQKELDLLNNAIATSKNIVANNTRKIKEAQDSLTRNSQKLKYLKEFIKDTKDNDTLSINAKTWNLKEDKKAKKDTKENDKQKTKSKEKENDVINQALAEVMKDFARKPDKMQIIGTYKGKNLMAYKTSNGVEIIMGDDLKNSFPLNKIDLKQAYYDELNYLTRLNNGYTRLIKGDYASLLEGQIYEKEIQLAKSKKALEKENANDLSQTQKLLEEKMYRQK